MSLPGFGGKCLRFGGKPSTFGGNRLRFGGKCLRFRPEGRDIRWQIGQFCYCRGRSRNVVRPSATLRAYAAAIAACWHPYRQQIRQCNNGDASSITPQDNSFGNGAVDRAAPVCPHNTFTEGSEDSCPIKRVERRRSFIRRVQPLRYDLEP